MLSHGTRLGPYEIVASLGRGGMSAGGCGERTAGAPNAGPTRGSRAWDPNAAAALGWSAGGKRGAAAPPSASERGWGPASSE